MLYKAIKSYKNVPESAARTVRGSGGALRSYAIAADMVPMRTISVWTLSVPLKGLYSSCYRLYIGLYTFYIGFI